MIRLLLLLLLLLLQIKTKKTYNFARLNPYDCYRTLQLLDYK